MKCLYCGKEKELCCFKEYITKTGKLSHRKICTECIKLKDRERYKARKGKIKEYRENNKEYFKKYNDKYYKSYIEKNRDKIKEKSKKYYYEHKQERIDYEKNKRKKDNLYRLKCNIRNVVNCSFRRYKEKKPKNVEKIIGCSIDYLSDYLLQTFKNNYGYEWDRIEKINIDHIIPLKTAQTEKDILKLNHYTNLQLLKEKDNLDKRDKINWNLKGE